MSTTSTTSTSSTGADVLDLELAEALSDRLADVFRSGEVGDVFTDDLFVDGHPPFWRFQIVGLDAFATWLRGYAGDGIDTTVVRTIPTASGFVTEFTGREHRDGELITDRKMLLCQVEGGRVREMTVFCSGDWDEQLRARHAAEARLVRP